MRSKGSSNVIGPVTVSACRPIPIPSQFKRPSNLLTSFFAPAILQSSACQIEAGELIAARLKGEDLIELGELVDDRLKPRAAVIAEALKGDVTIWKSVGLAPQDSMIATLVVERAEELGVGTIVEDYDRPN
jgi:hypothetical protein